MTIREFRLERYFARWEFAAPYLLSCSDCESMSIADVFELVGEPLSTLTSLRLGYTESQGDPALRTTIAQFYDQVDADQIVVTNAPEEAIFLSVLALLEPGDRVVVQTPCYQSLFELPAFRGCQVCSWPMQEGEEGWRLDLDQLADLVTPDTRLVIVNLPHNPTGYLPSLDEFEAVLSLVARHGIWLFCDEMYRGLEYDPGQRLPAAADRYPRAVSLWGMSKTFGLAGLRIGWLACTDARFIQEVQRLKDYTTICSSAPSELLTRLALSKAETLMQRNVGIIQANLAQVRPFMQRWASLFAWRAPLAGPIAFVRWHQGSALAFCEELVQGCGVLLVPSTVFDFGDRHLRWGFGRRNFGQGLSVLEEYLQRHWAHPSATLRPDAQ